MTAKLTMTPLAAALVVVLGGTVTIAGAWYFELVLGLEPCPLCLEQRWPYYIGMPLALIAAGLARAGRLQYAGLILALVALVMAYGAGLGAYHSGIEWELWKGPSACSGGGDGPGFATDAGALLESLSAGRIPSCADAPWRLLGLSLAGYNALICAALTIVAVTGAVAAHKHREQ